MSDDLTPDPPIVDGYVAEMPASYHGTGWEVVKAVSVLAIAVAATVLTTTVFIVLVTVGRGGGAECHGTDRVYYDRLHIPRAVSPYSGECPTDRPSASPDSGSSDEGPFTPDPSTTPPPPATPGSSRDRRI